MEIESFIQLHLKKERRHISKYNNPVINRHIQFHVSMIERAPRTMPEIEAMIQRKRIEIKNARSISEKQRLNTEYDALEWLKGAVKYHNHGWLSEDGYYC